MKKKVPLIFADICELHAGRALNILTGEESDVPDVDLLVAGFVVRKSVSTEHTQRQSYVCALMSALARQVRLFMAF